MRVVVVCAANLPLEPFLRGQSSSAQGAARGSKGHCKMCVSAVRAVRLNAGVHKFSPHMPGFLDCKGCAGLLPPLISLTYASLKKYAENMDALARNVSSRVPRPYCCSAYNIIETFSPSHCNSDRCNIQAAFDKLISALLPTSASNNAHSRGKQWYLHLTGGAPLLMHHAAFMLL